MTDPLSFSINRRAFLQGSTLTLVGGLGFSAPHRLVAASPKEPAVRLGVVTDLHYADKLPAGSRHYRETLDKLAEAAEHFRQAKPDFLVELGDLIDAAESVAVEQTYLKRINREFAPICDQRHYVLGNHCVDTLTKAEFLNEVEQTASYYSFDRNGFHFIVLDACFRSDGEPYGRKNSAWDDANIPATELDWLKHDLAESNRPTIVFAHQRLDGNSRHCVKNATEVRTIFEASGQVLAVFQGHSHANDYKEISGIHYATLVAMVEGDGPANNGYSLISLLENGTIQVEGFRRQANYDWPPHRNS